MYSDGHYICHRYHYRFFLQFITVKSSMHQHLTSKHMFFKSNISCMHVYGNINLLAHRAFDSACKGQNWHQYCYDICHMRI